MKANPGSIKRSLSSWGLLITSTVLIILGTSLYMEIKQSIRQSVVHALHSKIQILKGLLHEEQGAIEMELSEVVSGEYSIPRSGHYYKVLFENEVLAASPSLVNDDFDLESGKLVSYDVQLQQGVYTSTGPANEPIMVVRHEYMIFNSLATLYAAQSLEESNQLINRFSGILFVAIAINILILALAGFWITRRSLRPLEEFSSSIEKITHKTMGERIAPEFQVEEIKDVAASFNAMLDRLQGAFETEKRLVADASHELKTPLSVIKAQCEVLLQKDRSKEEYTRALSKINATSDTMKKLITDMLSLTRLDSGILSSSAFGNVSLRNCIDRAVKFAEFMASAKNVMININVPNNISINGDADALAEMFLNIIENGIKYSGADGTIDITHTEDSHGVTVEIKDCGTGIKEEDLKSIFARFYRADTSRSSEGTGLGLSIAGAVAEAHGGSIRVESQFGKGSSFFITLPVS